MNSSFLRLNVRDITKGLAVAVIGVVLSALQQALTAHGFNFGDYDWSFILNVSVMAGISYLTKNLLTTNDGQILGAI